MKPKPINQWEKRRMKNISVLQFFIYHCQKPKTIYQPPLFFLDSLSNNLYLQQKQRKLWKRKWIYHWVEEKEIISEATNCRFFLYNMGQYMSFFVLLQQKLKWACMDPFDEIRSPTAEVIRPQKYKYKIVSRI